MKTLKNHRKTLASGIGLILAALTIISVFPASIFAEHNFKLIAKIPFDFTAGDQQLPAGRYAIRRANNPGNPDLLIITNLETKASLLLQTRESMVSADSNPQLRFRNYGAQRFLAFVIDGSDNFGASIAKSKSEMAIINDVRGSLAQKNSQPEIITLAVTAGE